MIQSSNKTAIKKFLILGVVFITSLALFVGNRANADVLTAPENVSSCGNELSTAGTYTLTGDISTSTGQTCLSITSNGVILDGAGNDITGNIVGDGQNPGDPGYNFTVENATVTGTTSSNGIDNASGIGGAGGIITIATSTIGAVTANGGNYINSASDGTGGSGGSIIISSSTISVIDANGGYSNTISTDQTGGSGGSITVSSSTVAVITADGGASNNLLGIGSTGGSGGSIVITEANLDLSNMSISASKTTGSFEDGENGTLKLNYTTLNHTNLTLSALSDLVLNGSSSLPGDLGAFSGGTLDALPGDTITSISQCNLSFPGTYTLTADLTGNCNIMANGVVLDGAGDTLTGNVVGDGVNKGDWGHDFTVKDLTVTGTTSSNGADYGDFSAGVGAGGIITIIKDHIVLANEHFSVTGGNGTYGHSASGGLILDYSTIDLTNGTFPSVVGGSSTSAYFDTGLVLNGQGNSPGKLGPMDGGVFSNPGDTITDISECHMVQPGTYTLGTDLTGNCYIKSDSVVLDGAGHKITGTVNGDGYAGDAYDYTLQNITITGAITSTGIDTAYGGNNGSGGNITISNSTTTGATINVDSDVDAGDVTINGTDINLSNATIDASGATNGTLTLNYVTLKTATTTLSALSDLVLNGPEGLPGDLGAFAGGTLGALPGDTINDIAQCNFNVAGTYTLGSDLTGNCMITGSGVILNGAGHKITGGVYGNGINAGDSGYDFTLKDITVTGTTSSNGVSTPYSLYSDNGHNGGSITILDSTVATTTANGGITALGGYFGLGGNGGSITLATSTATLVETNGGRISLDDFDTTHYNVLPPDQLRELLNLLSNAPPASYGGKGGTIIISTSTTGTVISNGGDTIFGPGGDGGSVRVTNSLANPAGSIVSAIGGGVTYCGYGGSGGTVSLVDSTYITIMSDKGNDVTTTYANGGYCANQVTSPGSSVLSGSSIGSSGSVSSSGQYTPPALSQTPIAPTPTVTQIPPVEQPTSPISSGGSNSGSFVSTLPINNSSATTSFPVVIASTQQYPQSFGVVAAATVQKIAQKIADTANTVANSPGSKPVQAVGFFAGLMASTISIDTGLAIPLEAGDIFLIPVRLWGIILLGLGIKKRGRPWGTVYDSVTKQPIDPAFVTVKDVSGKVVAESITDLDGRYGFLLPDGTYYISVKKTNYEFPSKKMSGKSFDELYNDLYFGDAVIIKSGEVLDKNIPLDQNNFDWNEQAKKEQNLMLFHSKNERIWAVASNYIYGVGLAISVIVVMAKPSSFNILILIAYALVLAFLEFGIKKKKLGYILDKNTGEPLSYAIFRVTTLDHQVVLRSGVCDAKGRYYCIVPKGEYRVDIEKKNTNGSYSRVYESSQISSNSGIINKNFIV